MTKTITQSFSTIQACPIIVVSSSTFPHSLLYQNPIKEKSTVLSVTHPHYYNYGPRAIVNEMERCIRYRMKTHGINLCSPSGILKND